MEKESYIDMFIKLSEFISDAVIISKYDKCIGINKAAEKLFNIGEELKGKNVADIFAEHGANNTCNKLKNLGEKKTSFTPFIDKLTSSDGKNKQISVTFISTENHELLIILKDITRERIADKEIKYYSTISHELKTPINIVISSLKLLEIYTKNKNNFVRDDKVKQYINVIRRNCFRVIKIVDDIIDINKIEQGFFKIHLGNFDIVEIVKGLVLSCKEIFEMKGISIDFYSEFDKKIIACDREKIERVILNLLSNSFKFTNKGGYVKISMTKGDNGYIDISVEDNGQGIPSEMQNKVFNKFVQVESEENYCGTGIGLSLVKSIMEAHGGSVELESKYKEGSRFILKLPDRNIKGKKSEDLSYLKFYDDAISNKVNVEFSDIM